MTVTQGTQITNHVEYGMLFGLPGRTIECVLGRFLLKSMFDARSRAARRSLEEHLAARVPDC
jgi:ligand-binding SRPBCC domain-containing protein